MSVISAFDLAAEFEALSLLIVAEYQEALDHAAEIVEVRAKEILGEYQDDTGPFAPWRELAASTLADKAAHGYPMPSPLLRTGEMRDSIERTVEPRRALVGSDSDIAMWQELGTHGPNPGADGYHVPPRSFLGAAAFQKEDEVADILGFGALDQVFNGRAMKSIR